MTTERRIALVTGASRGIGRAIAERLARDGVLVAVHYGTQRAAAEAVAARIGNGAFAIGQPFGADGDVEALFARLDEELRRRTGEARLDVLVSNAAIVVEGDLATTTPADFDAQMAVNARAPLFLAQAAAARMRAGGRIVTISSGVSRRAYPELLAYSMSKAAIDVMSLQLAKELAPRGITVNVVSPGVLDTDMNAHWLRGDEQAAAAVVSAFGRLGEPADVADVVAFAASDDARFVTGQFLDATGGMLL
jgi:NAD(P)-dependent dehydrogenase (short-subunit alcohol dehydrogenase family)